MTGQVWIDLGAGSGTFTTALAELVGVTGHVFAVDKDAAALNRISARKPASITILLCDFEKDSLAIDPADGILISNALHFVSDKNALFQKIRKLIKPGGRMIIVEYDTTSGNYWIPFPLSRAGLHRKAEQWGLSVTDLGVLPSRYHISNLYAVLLLGF